MHSSSTLIKIYLFMKKLCIYVITLENLCNYVIKYGNFMFYVITYLCYLVAAVTCMRANNSDYYITKDSLQPHTIILLHIMCMTTHSTLHIHLGDYRRNRQFRCY